MSMRPLPCDRDEFRACRMGACVVPFWSVSNFLLLAVKRRMWHDTFRGPGYLVTACESHIGASERPRKLPHESLSAPQAILWAPSYTPTHCTVSRETLNSLSIHPSRCLLFRPRAARDLYQIASHLSGQGLHPLPVDFFSHTGALATESQNPQGHPMILCGSRESAGRRWVGWLLR
jgi:hypothetical protein